MANPSKQKGTAYETRLLRKLQQIWPNLDRAKAGNESCDFHGAPFPIEAKKRKTWSIPEWVRRLRFIARDEPWVLFVEDGDLRSAKSAGEIMIVDADFGRELLSLYQNAASFEGFYNELLDEAQIPKHSPLRAHRCP